METIGERVKKIRKSIDYVKNQSDFAEGIGITQASLAQIENGTTKKISKPVLMLMELKYKVNIGYLLSGNGEMFKAETDSVKNTSSNEVNGNGNSSIVGGNIVGGNMQNVGNSRYYDVPASGFLKIIYPDGREETIAGDSSLLELSNEIKLLKAENAYLTDKIAMKDEVIGSMKELVLELKHKQ